MSEAQTSRPAIQTLKQNLQDQIIGQPRLVERLLISLLADGHLLVQGAPGLAKTRAIKTLAEGIEGDFQRIQFTPDLLPSDVTGSEIYRAETQNFVFQPGPLFHNLVLADEINRAPAKVQSALLEAMAERQVTVGGKTYPLPPLFLVMATQNPIEQEGTYPLPEAQLDRFLMQVLIDYPGASDELSILRLTREEARKSIETVQSEVSRISQSALFAARQEVLGLHMAESVEQYIVTLVVSTRQSGSSASAATGSSRAPLNTPGEALEYGASPRATLALDRCARAHAWLQGKDFVAPEDVQAIAHDVLRHRLILSYEAEARGLTTDQVIDRLLQEIPLP